MRLPTREASRQLRRWACPPIGGTAEASLAEALRGREVLLVLDNFEQLLEAAGLLARLLAAAPGLRLLVTSRIALRLYGEHALRVPPLQLPADAPGTVQDSEAVQLFLARAQAARPGFAPDAAETAAIGEICTALDGLPLAIELAAAKVRLYTPQALRPLLDSRLELLTGGPRDVPRRQQTLRATLDWSYELLPACIRRLFTRLGVFAGPFDAAAAAATAGPGPMLDQLADQGLLEVTAGQTPSFRMLQTVREYALARLAEAGDHDEARRRHLAHYHELVVAARAGYGGPGPPEELDRLAAAYPDLRAALEFACEQAESDAARLNRGLSLAAGLYWLWVRRGPLAEGTLHLSRLLELDDAMHASTPQRRTQAVLAAGPLFCLKGDFSRAAELARHAIELCAPASDHEGLSWAYLLLGEAVIAVGDDDSAELHYQRVLTEASQAGHLRNQAEAWHMLGQIARHRGDFGRASSLLDRALELYRTDNKPSNMGSVLAGLGEVARDAGRPAQARQFFAAALRQHAASGDKRQIAYDLEGFAAAAALEQAGRQALVYLGAAQILREQTGGPLPPVEQRILDRILTPATAALPDRERQDALSEGRNQPLPAIIARALA
jgi:predicted ATPase/Tfp pilus assembly protein PilF